MYVHFAHKPATVARFASLLSGIPYAMSAHAKDIWLTSPEELALKVQDAEAVLTCTEEARNYVERMAGGATPVRLAYHGVDLPARVPARPQNDRPVVLTVGRLVEKKDHATLLRGFRHVHRRISSLSVPRTRAKGLMTTGRCRRRP